MNPIGHQDEVMVVLPIGTDCRELKFRADGLPQRLVAMFHNAVQDYATRRTGRLRAEINELLGRAKR